MMIRMLLAAAMVLPAGAADTRAFLEQDGLVVVEIESAAPAAGWEVQDSIAGFAGDAYYTWSTGNPYDVQSAGAGVLMYRVKIATPGTYYFRVHCYHDFPDDQTLENDAWVRVDGESWKKLFQPGGNAGYWNWFSQIEYPHGTYIFPTYVLDAGYHTIEFSGRSYRFSIDRFHLSKDMPLIGTSKPVSLREGDTVPVRLEPGKVVIRGGSSSAVYDISGRLHHGAGGCGIFITDTAAGELRPVYLYK